MKNIYYVPEDCIHLSTSVFGVSIQTFGWSSAAVLPTAPQLTQKMRLVRHQDILFIDGIAQRIPSDMPMDYYNFAQGEEERLQIICFGDYRGTYFEFLQQ